jgi:hypothetical protein
MLSGRCPYLMKQIWIGLLPDNIRTTRLSLVMRRLLAISGHIRKGFFIYGCH